MVFARTILRLKRTDTDASSTDSVVVQISQQNAASNGSLDIKVLGTENEGEYAGKVTASSLKTLRARNYNGNDEEWEAVLKKTLLQGTVNSDLTPKLVDVECVATVTAGKELTLVWRRDTGGIIQRLGSLSLTPVEGEIDLFEWHLIAAEANKLAREDLLQRDAQMKRQIDTIKQLQDQLDDIVKAKADHEAQLLAKFCKILNTKKLKIRDQQRLLATSKPDSSLVNQLKEDSEEERKPTTKQQTRASRAGKRKASESAQPASDSDEGFEPAHQEQMEIDDAEDDDRQASADQVTPDPTDIDSSDDDDLDRQSLSKPSETIGQSQRSTRASRARPKGESVASSLSGTAKDTRSNAIPARRELPFKSGTTAKGDGALPLRNKALPAANADADETDSDDEL